MITTNFILYESNFMCFLIQLKNNNNVFGYKPLKRPALRFPGSNLISVLFPREPKLIKQIG